MCLVRRASFLVADACGMGEGSEIGAGTKVVQRRRLTSGAERDVKRRRVLSLLVEVTA